MTNSKKPKVPKKVEQEKIETVRYTFKPTKDITPYEAALLIPVIAGLGASTEEYINSHKLTKHFIKEES